MVLLTPLLVTLSLSGLEPLQDTGRQTTTLTFSKEAPASTENADTEKLKFTKEWPTGLQGPHTALALRKPAEAKRGLDFIYEEMTKHNSDSQEWKGLWDEYRIYSCLLADYEGRFSERDKWLSSFPLEETDQRQYPSILAPLALGKKITSKGYKLTSRELEEFASIKINGSKAIDFFGDRGVQSVKDAKIWAEVVAINRFYGSMRGQAEIHCERLWELDKRQSLSALFLCRSLIGRDKPEEALELAVASLPYAPKGRIFDLISGDKLFAESRVYQKKHGIGYYKDKKGGAHKSL